VQLRWHWADEAATTRLVARQGSPPNGPEDPLALVTVVTREDYDRLGSWTISLPLVRNETRNLSEQRLKGDSPGDLPVVPDRWYITAYSADLDNGVTVFSSGFEPSATTAVAGPLPEVTVSYVLKRPWIPRRPWTVAIRTEPAGVDVPPMVLVANNRAIPLSAEDGEIVARLPACRDGANHTVRTNLNLSRRGVRAFPDPTLEPGSSPPFRLRHPDAGPTRA
jgi:hypothetical protein